MSDSQRRAEILDVAASLFASSGIRTSLKDIADACGILPGSLYHHFDSKDALVVEIVERYHRDLDALAATAVDALTGVDVGHREHFVEHVADLGARIADCAVRHRAALLLTLYEPPSTASDELVRATSRSPGTIEKAMATTLRAGRDAGVVRHGIDLEALSDRLCQVLLHVSLGMLRGVPGASEIPSIRCRALLHGIAARTPSDHALISSAAFSAAQQTIDGWSETDDAGDRRLPLLRAAARSEFGRRGHEATTVRDIAAAAGLSIGTVYRLVGSKDELLGSIMSSFVDVARSAWSTVLATDSTVIEKLDALMWVDICAVDRFRDEYNIQLAWIRESPPTSADLGTSFAARLGDVKALLSAGGRSGELEVEGRNADVRAWALFELLWMPENLVRDLGPAGSLALGRDTLLRGALA